MLITNENTEESVRFVCLRNFLFSKIREAFEKEGAIGKSTEGAFEVVHCFPDYYEEEYKTPYSGECWIIRLYCYVVGPSRHYEWSGRNLLDAVKKAEKEIYGWFGQEPPEEDQPDDYDPCYECRGYGDDYHFDEDGELVLNCPDCPLNEKEDA